MQRQVGRAQPIVLARVGEFVGQQPGTMAGEKRRFHDNGVADGDGAEAAESPLGQPVEPSARGRGADPLGLPAAADSRHGVADERGWGGPERPRQTCRAATANSWNHYWKHAPNLSSNGPGQETWAKYVYKIVAILAWQGKFYPPHRNPR